LPKIDTWAVSIVHDLDAVSHGDGLRFVPLEARSPVINLPVGAREAIIHGRDIVSRAPASRLGFDVNVFSEANREDSVILQVLGDPVLWKHESRGPQRILICRFEFLWRRCVVAF
jgi:hypothetical protein